MELWQEMDNFYKINRSCSQDSTHYAKMLEEDIIFYFLHALNTELDEVKGSILVLNLCPPLGKCLLKYGKKKVGKKVMLQTPTSASRIDSCFKDQC